MGILNINQEKFLALSKKAYISIEKLLPESDRQQIYEFIYLHNEWGLGIETIIDVIHEENIRVTDIQLQAIKNACNAMKIDFNKIQN